MLDVITFGEAMIRLSPPNNERFEQATSLDFRVGGSEANVAVALSRLGLKTSWVSKLTDNPLGRKIKNEIQRWNVDVSQVIWTPDYRVGTYYVEFGSDPRPSSVIYDRKDSAFSNLKINEINWKFLESCKLFHTSGITVALSDNCAEAVKKCLKIVKENKKLTSFDMNYRSKLWSPKEASSKLNEILPDVDILFSSEKDIDLLFKSNLDLKGKCLDLIKKYSLSLIVLTRGPDPPYALDSKDNELYGKGYRPKLVDRIGAGDAFAAGFIYGYLQNDLDKAMKHAEAMSALKFSIPGDFALVYKNEVENFIKEGEKYIKR